jgi:uncharacterized protein YndB with AHSA1/START domain
VFRRIEASHVGRDSLRLHCYGEGMKEQLHHATIVLERAYPAPIERVFAEFADPQARAKWSALSGDALVYEENEFREGGRDVFRCGPPNDLRFRGVTTYQLIAPNRCVISTEALSEGARRLAVALNTLDFEPTAEGTNLKVTIQMISFAGPGMVEGYESGNRGALEGLSRHLAAIR